MRRILPDKRGHKTTERPASVYVICLSTLGFTERPFAILSEEDMPEGCREVARYTAHGARRAINQYKAWRRQEKAA